VKGFIQRVVVEKAFPEVEETLHFDIKPSFLSHFTLQGIFERFRQFRATARQVATILPTAG
jgi:hypothetical protein